MKKVNYEEMLEKVLDVLRMENIIDDIDWSFTDTYEILNIFIQNKIYSFETKNNYKNIKITIDTLEDQ